MGRYHHKEYLLMQQKGSNISDSSAPNDLLPKHFTTRERKLLLQYLRDYKAGVLAIVRDEPLSLIESENIVASSADGTEPLHISIGGHPFPPLCPETTLRQPYLILPKELSSKKRRIVHEISIDVGLYHTSIGSNQNERYIAISPFHDGLDYVPGIKTEERDGPKISLRGFTPWACREQIVQQDTTTTPDAVMKEMRDVIYELIDQPGRCLRESIDVLNFPVMEGQDLSTIPPPTPGAYQMVDTSEKMIHCVHELTNAGITELAFDLECFNKSRYAQMTCLIQLAASGGMEYVIDVLAPGVWDEVGRLAPIFADPEIVKIGHSIGGLDVRCLHRDFGIFVVNAFDTCEASNCLRLTGKGLAKVCAHYGMKDPETYEALKARYQTADWTHRPLSVSMIQYGRYDVHYLIHLRRLMMRDLCRQEMWVDHDEQHRRDDEARQVATSLAAILRRFDEDEGYSDEEEEPGVVDVSGFATPAQAPSGIVTPKEPPTRHGSLYEDALENIVDEYVDEKKAVFEARDLRMNVDLMQVISRSQDRCLDLWNDSSEPHGKNPEYQSMIFRAKCGEMEEWTQSQLELYEILAKWREDVAAREKCTASFICALSLLAAVAYRRPTNEMALKQLTYELPGCFEENRSYMVELFKLVAESRVRDGLPKENPNNDVPSYEGLIRKANRGVFPWVDASGGSARQFLVVGTILGVAGVVATLLFRSRRRP